MVGRPASAGSQSALREANSARILEAVRRFGGITQVELVEATGLSPATVSTIVKNLLAAGVVETRNTVRSGRRASLVTLAHQQGLLVGVQIGARAMRLALADTGFQLLEKRALPLPADHRLDTTLDRVALLIVELVEEMGSALGEVRGIGVALPAPVDPATGQIALPGIMRGWEGERVGDVIEARLRQPTFVDNDANLGALGEARFGAARGYRDVVYVRASYDTGAGILLGGAIHHGVRGTAGEIGHALVDPLGPICRCGSRGCLNTVVGAQSLIDSLQFSHGTMSLADLIRFAQEGDPGCRQVVEDAGAVIGTVVANTAVALSPGVVVVGGELARTGELLIEPVQNAVARRVLLGRDGTLPVVRGQLEDDAEVMGALALASDHVVAGGQQ